MLFSDRDSFESVPVYRWEDLDHDASFDGPTVIDRTTTTVVVLPGQRVEVRPGKGLVIFDDLVVGGQRSNPEVVAVSAGP